MGYEKEEYERDIHDQGPLLGKSGKLMDEEREKQLAYEYLCRLEEVRRWVESCIHESLPSPTEFESQLRNGILLAKLAHFFAPEVVSLKRIFDPLGEKYEESGLHFRHTDNINHFLRACSEIGLPSIFTPETTDVYDAKNLPRVVFCLHALSLFLFKIGMAPEMMDLGGKATFTPQELSQTQAALKELDSPMPQFHRLNKDPSLASPVRLPRIENIDSHQKLRSALQDFDRIQDEAIVRYHMRFRKNRDRNTPLRPAEIQNIIDEVNVLVELEEVIKYKKANDLREALEPWKLRVDFDVSKTEMYLEFLYHALLALDGEEELKKETIEAAMMEANRRDHEHSYKESVTRLNEALRGDDISATLDYLRRLDVPFHSFAGNLYHDELRYILVETGRDLKRDSVLSLVQFLNNVASVNQAVRFRNVEETWRTLTLKNTNIEDLDSDLKENYLEALSCALESKDGMLLTHFEIQDAVDAVNKSTSDDIIEALQNINSALKRKDPSLLYKSLTNPVLKLETIEEDDATHTLDLLEQIAVNRSILEHEESEIWVDNVFDAVHQTIQHTKEATDAGFALSIANMAIQQGDHAHTFETLNHPSLFLTDYLIKEHSKTYQERLLQRFNEKEAEGTTPWVKHALSDGHGFVYLNLKEHIYSWTQPEEVHSSSTFLDYQDILDILEHVNRLGGVIKDYDQVIVGLQARIRGYIIRQRLLSMLQHYYDNVDSIIKVQAHVRGHQTRKRFKDALAQLRRNRSPVLKPIASYLPYEEGIIKIQRAWRKHKKAIDLQALMKVDTQGKINLNVVRKYLYLLDHSMEDFDQELNLQSLKGNITKVIRFNQNLEKNLDVMDIKIGLLVKNRISVEEVVAHSKTLNHHSNNHHRASTLNLLRNDDDTNNNNSNSNHGLKALKKESRTKLDAYQNLFYYLQTNPQTLAKLIFAMPQLKTTKFMESVILSLYNFGANQREEYLLLKLFQTALEEEVRCKVDKPSDIITGQPMVIKMIVSFYRNGGKGSNSLREMLGTIILRVLEDKNLSINTNPVEIYKQWVNSKEFESGQASGMPYDVTPQEALSHEEVRKRLNRSVIKLKQVTTMFLATILSSRHKIPYGMLYMARVLYVSLKKKFPSIQQKEILKVVGNLLYYRFINGAIVAPDAFDIIGVSADNILNNEQRRNLGSISKILQFAASKKGYGEESSHLMCLNGYIIECHEKFKKFFLQCVDEVVSPEEEFNMDQYYEATLIAKPVIFISLQEIVDTHQLLLDFQDTVAPDTSDPLHELLDDLGDGGPSLCSLLGVASASTNASLGNLGTSEVCLTLTNKFELSGFDRSDTEELFIKTKHLIMSILPCTKEGNLIGCLKSETTQEFETLYWQLVNQKEEEEKEATRNKSMLDHTNPFINDECRLPLADCKRQILKNLMVLEVAGLVTSKDGCKSLINSIIKSILNRRQYRLRRQREIFRLNLTLKSLKLKKKFLEEQVEYYDTYLKQCLKNLQVNKRRRVHFQQPLKKSSPSSNSQTVSESHHHHRWGTRMKSRSTLRYSASRLHEKGVLLAIDGLPPSQFKNVQFEIVPTENDGVFEVHAKFMGVRLEHVDVNIQDLLQFQYEGVSVMNMFGKANINVNLLLHFLNSKFYGRKK
uniref:Ras GTPaseactivatinglike protein IQGAP1like [Bombyx mori] n=1 Tax=Lepeophtheirus salmonis TaxID=72036 RepID=A0A0K2T0J2_LEPSM